jgi:hypothetical protein
MKNIHVLPTDKPSRLIKNSNENTLNLCIQTLPLDEEIYCYPQHIYITSDGFIEEGDFSLNLSTKNIIQYDGIKGLDSYYKKIILTTDQDLIADGIQEIDETFLEWFVKNPSCEYVEVNEKLIIIQDKPLVQHQGNKPIVVPHRINYKIIIPQEPKPIHQQIIDIVGGEDRFREIANLNPKQETLKKVEENIDREEWIHFFKNNSKEEILEYLIDYKFPL